MSMPLSGFHRHFCASHFSIHQALMEIQYSKSELDGDAVDVCCTHHLSH